MTKEFNETINALKKIIPDYRLGPEGMSPTPGEVFDRIPPGDTFGRAIKLDAVQRWVLPDDARDKGIAEAKNFVAAYEENMEAFRAIEFNNMVHDVTQYAYDKIYNPGNIKLGMFNRLPDGKEVIEGLVSGLGLNRERFESMRAGGHLQESLTNGWGPISSVDAGKALGELEEQEAAAAFKLKSIYDNAVKEAKAKNAWPPKDFNFRGEHFGDTRKDTEQYAGRTLETLEKCGDLTDEDMKYGVETYLKNFDADDLDRLFIDGKSLNDFCDDKAAAPSREEKMCLVTAAILGKRNRVDFRIDDPSRADKLSVPICVKPSLSPEKKKPGFFSSLASYAKNIFNAEKRGEAWGNMWAALGYDPDPRHTTALAGERVGGAEGARHKKIIDDYFIDRRTEDERFQAQFNEEFEMDMQGPEVDYMSVSELQEEHDAIMAGCATKLDGKIDHLLQAEEDKDERDLENVTTLVKSVKKPPVFGVATMRDLTELYSLGVEDKDSLIRFGKLLEASANDTEVKISGADKKKIVQDFANIMKNVNKLEMPNADITDANSIVNNYTRLDKLARHGGTLGKLFDALPVDVKTNIAEADAKVAKKKPADNQLDGFMDKLGALKVLNIANPAAQIRETAGLYLGAERSNIKGEVKNKRDVIDKIHLSQELCKEAKNMLEPGALKLVKGAKISGLSDTAEKITEEMSAERKKPESAKKREDMIAGIIMKTGGTKELLDRHEKWKEESGKTKHHLDGLKKQQEENDLAAEAKRKQQEEIGRQKEDERKRKRGSIDRRVADKRAAWLEANKPDSDELKTLKSKQGGMNFKALNEKVSPNSNASLNNRQSRDSLSLNNIKTSGVKQKK